MKKAFTLAEVLIVLAIIGIIASITIPSVVLKNQKADLYARFMRTYSTLLTAFNISISKYGDPWYWNTYQNPNYFQTYLLPNLKNAKICDSAANCFGENYENMNGEVNLNVNAVVRRNPSAIKLATGATVAHYNGGLIFDVNGPKGPNVTGRDLFGVRLTCPEYDVPYCHGKPFCFKKYDSGREDSKEDESLMLKSSNPNFCVKSNGANYTACVVKLLIDGKMNY